MSIFRLVPVAVLLAAMPAPAAEVKTLKNDSIKGELASINEKEVVLDVGGGKKVTTPINQVLLIDLGNPVVPPGADVKYALVELSDGTQVKCANYALKGKDAKLTLLGGQTVDVPIAQISWILNEAHDAAIVKEFKEKVLAKKKNRDIIAVKFEDVINARLGTFGDVDEKGEKIEWVTEKGEKRELLIRNLIGLFFIRGANPEAKPVICRLSDTTRDMAYVSKVTQEGGVLTVVTSCGATIKYPLASVAKLDYSTGKLAYLSQLTPSSVTETSTEGSVQHYTRDTNLDGGKIKIAGVEYKSGISLHSYTELVYDLDGEYRELKAMVGIDDEVGGDDGPTKLTIYADETEVVNWTITRGDKQRVRNLNVSVKDAKKLRIVVTTGDLLDVGKHVTLGDARVTK